MHFYMGERENREWWSMNSTVWLNSIISKDITSSDGTCCLKEAKSGANYGWFEPQTGCRLVGRVLGRFLIYCLNAFLWGYTLLKNGSILLFSSFLSVSHSVWHTYMTHISSQLIDLFSVGRKGDPPNMFKNGSRLSWNLLTSESFCNLGEQIL